MKKTHFFRQLMFFHKKMQKIAVDSNFSSRGFYSSLEYIEQVNR